MGVFALGPQVLTYRPQILRKAIKYSAIPAKLMFMSNSVVEIELESDENQRKKFVFLQSLDG